MEFIDLKSQFKALQPELEQSVLRVLRSGNYIMGDEVRSLEAELEKYVGAEHCISCSSGTDALVMSLMALGIGAGDAVICPTFTFVATAEAIATVGAVPLFVDSGSDFNICIDSLQHLLTKVASSERLIPTPCGRSILERELNVKAVMTVDLFGLPCDYDRINALVKDHNLKLIVDAAQSFGAQFKGRSTLAFGDVACTSFFPAKPLGCYGDGGAIFTNDDHTAEQLRSIRVHGSGTHKYENVRLGLTARLDEVQAAILRVKLGAFDEELRERQRLADSYGGAINALKLKAFRAPQVGSDCTSAWAQYTLLCKDEESRLRLQEAFRVEEVPTVQYYPKPLHLQPVFSYLGYPRGSFPFSEAAATRVLSLPMHPYMTQENLDRIQGVLNEYSD